LKYVGAKNSPNASKMKGRGVPVSLEAVVASRTSSSSGYTCIVR
jgi:hypothetical protein